MNKKAALVALSVIIIPSLLFLGSLLQASQSSASASNREVYKQLTLFGDVFKRVRESYVDKPNEQKLIHAALSGMLTSLDPHSGFMNPDDYKDFTVQTQGEFGGLGIQVNKQKGKPITVIAPMDGTPAHKAGVLAGDLITHLDGKSILSMTLKAAVKKMRGKPKTAITLTIYRKGKEKPLKIKVVRDIIVLKAVSQSIDKDIGIIRITSFTDKTQVGLEKAFKAFNKELGQNAKGYILDLRNNPGGLLNQALSVSDSFLERGEIVSTRGRKAEETKKYRAEKGDLAGGKPVVVLINGGSASASEIVAGALQDHGRATIMGTRSFGKGSVQTVFPLGTGRGRDGAIRLTTAKYYTPGGHEIQAKGITPDIIVNQIIPEDEKDKNAIKGEAALEGHLKNDEEGEEVSGSSGYVPKKKEDDIQLKKALEKLRGVMAAKLQEPKTAQKTAKTTKTTKTSTKN